MASTEVMPSPHLVGSISLDSKIVLITGAGSGINLTFAKLAHHHGARILIADISLTSEAHDLLNSDPTNIKYQRTDVTKWTELEALFSNCLQYFADVPDVVVPGAGVYEPNFSNFWADTENSDEYKTISINVNHVIKLTRLAVRALVSRGKKGVICPVSSQVGLVGVYTSPLYCASKHAVVGFVRSMGPAERFEGVKVVAVCPGGANTNIWDSGGWRETLGIDHIPKDMMCTREQIAQAMFELITEGKYGGGTIIDIPPNAEFSLVPYLDTPAWTGPSPVPAAMMSASAEMPPFFKKARDGTDADREKIWPSVGAHNAVEV